MCFISNAIAEEKIREGIKIQEEIGIDVLVTGEFERNDMVEYFGGKLTGFAFTENGWVQSFGSRYVKPPIIWADVIREHPMTVEENKYAASLTKKHVKGMLTGPITILQVCSCVVVFCNINGSLVVFCARGPASLNYCSPDCPCCTR